MTTRCPACGSEDVTFSVVEKTFSVPFGKPVTCMLDRAACQRCDATGDFAKTNDAKIEAAIEESEKSALAELLSRMGEFAQSAYVERVLGLPARTIARWKTGHASAAATALLRFIVTYPWLLEVAENRFAPREADRHVVRAFRDAFERLHWSEPDAPTVVSATGTAGSAPTSAACAGQVTVVLSTSAQTTSSVTVYAEPAVGQAA